MSVDTACGDAQKARDDAARFQEAYGKIKAEVSRMMVGQDEVIDGVLTALLAGGHVLLEGVPGLGKTMLVRSLGEAMDVNFSRIQFTPDLMPADIQGTTVLMETEGGGHELKFQEGPLIANIVLADEINRATPKTQSALLEAMQEKQLTVGRRVIKMDEPYCVMATQNPVEQEGTYPLPEAQLDRFLFKLIVGYPSEQDYHDIIDRTTGDQGVDISPVSNAEEINDLRSIVRAVPVPNKAKSYAIRLVIATQPDGDYAPEKVREFVSLGSSPRGVQGLMLAAKVKALLGGRFAVSVDDVKAVALPVLRHRIALNFHAQSEGVDSDAVIAEILDSVRAPDDIE
ncbi:MoxR family ATPase [Porticoccus sp. W117]|uniref:AAA family ATPase n=1 Tax=Porticoccus sp. W117 TaxID=3054777 RepID=UPI002592EB84|nr:MoxR family ATPase [Porticoccus sp. W117]MDM3872152.1 MoxR family ATPase [Porticoccus sp. W117]